MTSIARTKALPAISARIAAVRNASTASTGEASAAEGLAAAGVATRRPNWLEENCGDVPTHPHRQDDEISEMLRGGHAIQLSSARRGGATAYDETHVQTLQELKVVEEKAIERIENAVKERGFRFRPSALIPLVQCSNAVVGGALTLFGENVSTSYVTGVKIAISDYYNDQIREIYEKKPDQTELKELFKTARDEELEFVDAHTPDALDPISKEEDSNSVITFAKVSSKVLLQISKTV
ncbi:Ubiquinone biosynthesis protein coq7, partial [Globisporangium splendens]